MKTHIKRTVKPLLGCVIGIFAAYMIKPYISADLDSLVRMSFPSIGILVGIYANMKAKNIKDTE